MIYLVFLAVGLAWLIGMAVVVICFQESFLEHFILKAFLGLAAGLGISSILYFFFSLLFDPSRRRYFIFEGIILLALLYFALRGQLKRAHPRPSFRVKSWLTTLIAAVLAVFLAAALWSALDSFNRLTVNEPHGRYDAWAIWDYRARFIFRGGAHWLDAVSPLQFHADYPLMLPLSISRVWLFAGQEIQKGVIILAGLFTFGGIGLLAAGLGYAKKATLGLLAAFFLTTASTFIHNGSILFADVPQSFFILSAAILIYSAFAHGREKPGLIFLAGLSTGLCGWVKNEGLLFMFLLLTFSTLSFLLAFKDKRKSVLTLYLAGAALPLVTILYFKLFISAPNDLVNPQNLSTILEKITDPSRYEILYRESQTYFAAFGRWELPHLLLLAVFAALAFGKIPAGSKTGVRVLIIVFALQWIGYYAIYLITPYELASHFHQSILRLIVHTHPAFLFTLFLLIKAPEEILSKILPARAEGIGK